MSLPTVEMALAQMLAWVRGLDSEDVSLADADGRWMTEPVIAGRDQPPFDASSMDGWAVLDADVTGGATLRIAGESVAGKGLETGILSGEAVRIFTGAPVPVGADRVVIQEEVERRGDVAVFKATASEGRYIRPKGCDFRSGDVLLPIGTLLNPWRLALAASAGVSVLKCVRRPRVAILATGDELVDPGQQAGTDQIYDSATPALAAFVRRQGGTPLILPRAGDDQEVIASRISGAVFDVLVTVGGASVGDHDLVKPALVDLGATLHVEGVAMRPGKPVWFATLEDRRPVLGLPGNPASALVCAELFLAPVLAMQQGESIGDRFETVALNGTLPPNGPRDHYIRAHAEVGADGIRRVSPFANQDSSLVSVMASANALIRRLPNAPAVADGELVSVLGPRL